MPFDHLTRFVIHNFRSLFRLCHGPRSPLGLDKLASELFAEVGDGMKG
jgi:hypothetical protein